MTPRILICVFDGLRPDLITQELTPNLYRFREQGALFPHSRSVFPSATRVNAAALGSGSTPQHTGIIANKFFDPSVFPDRPVHTGMTADLTALEAAYSGRLVTATTLGEVLAEHGQRMSVVSTASGGTTLLVNPQAAVLGQTTLSLREWDASCPSKLAAEMVERHGPIPPAAMPNTPRIAHQVDLFLNEIEPRENAALSLLWFSDPDSTLHKNGLGTETSNAAIHGVDAQFGRLMAWWQADPALREQLQVVVVSDHGHLTARKRVDVKAAFTDAGLRYGATLTEHDYSGALGYQGAVSVRGHDPALLGKLVAVLKEQPWCGLLFTPGGDGVQGGVPGTLARSLLNLEHPRAPDLYYVMRNDGAPNAQGVPGSCFFDSTEYGEGGSTHGGLHPLEMNNLLMAQGSRFKSGHISPLPAGIVDVAPTVLELLGLPRPQSMTGRVLTEALDGAAANGDSPAPEWNTAVTGESTRRMVLRSAHVGSQRYVDSGWVE